MEGRWSRGPVGTGRLNMATNWREFWTTLRRAKSVCAEYFGAEVEEGGEPDEEKGRVGGSTARWGETESVIGLGKDRWMEEGDDERYRTFEELVEEDSGSWESKSMETRES